MPDHPPELGFLELVPYGLWGCAVRTETGRAAIILTWMTQLSFDPPLIGVSLESDAQFLNHILLAGEFTVSALPRATGKAIAQRILKEGMKASHEGNLRLFSSVPDWLEAIEGAVAAARCRVVGHHQVGDHTVVEAEVVREHRWVPDSVLRLSDTGWKYRRAPSQQHRPS